MFLGLYHSSHAFSLMDQVSSALSSRHHDVSLIMTAHMLLPSAYPNSHLVPVDFDAAQTASPKSHILVCPLVVVDAGDFHCAVR